MPFARPLAFKSKEGETMAIAIIIIALCLIACFSSSHWALNSVPGYVLLDCLKHTWDQQKRKDPSVNPLSLLLRHSDQHK
jgi:hypothetical protein